MPENPGTEIDAYFLGSDDTIPAHGGFHSGCDDFPPLCIARLEAAAARQHAPGRQDPFSGPLHIMHVHGNKWHSHSLETLRVGLRQEIGRDITFE